MRLRRRDDNKHRRPKILAILFAAWVALATGSYLLGMSGGDVAKIFMPIGVALSVAPFSARLQELGKRQPKLHVRPVVEHDAAAGATGLIESAVRRPWPIDVERIVADELREARESLKLRHSALDTFLYSTDPFAQRPTEAEHHKAREAFEETVVEYGEELRSWLKDYREAARARSELFDFVVQVGNSRGGAHAEDVMIEIDLPNTVVAIDEWPVVVEPPERPVYTPPSPRRGDHLLRRRPVMPLDWPAAIEPVALDRASKWTLAPSGRRLSATVGGVHADQIVDVATPLLLRASGHGDHPLSCRVYTKSASKPFEETIVLRVPADEPELPPFGRMAGVLQFPDVPMVSADDSDEVIRDVRAMDPPLLPPSSADDDDGPLARIRESYRYGEWLALGLDPTTDGPLYRVEPATRRADELASDALDD